MPQTNPYIFKRANIKAGMEKHIAKLWAEEGEAPVNVAALDPLVHYLIGALSVELEKMGNEIYNNQTQILQHIAQLLLPDVLSMASPAHAIAKARSYSPQYQLKKQDQFYFSKTLVTQQQDEIQQEFYFSPVETTQIFDGQILYIANEKNIHFINEFNQKEFVAHAQGYQKQPTSALPTPTLWIALALPETLKTLPLLTFYFDWEHTSFAEKEHNFQLLSQVKCALNGKKIAIQQGLLLDESSANQNFKLLKELDSSLKIKNEVLNFYQNQFISLANVDENKINISELTANYPKHFENIYSKEDLKNFKEPLLWFAFEFPQFVHQNILNNIQCHINCFPVMNRQWHQQSHALHAHINIIPLKANNQFLGIEKVYSVDGENYEYAPFSHINNQKKQTYSIRKKGVERFDKRNAKQLLNYLLELIRDESAAFTALGRDRLQSRIEELNRTMSRIEHDLSKNKDIGEPPTYLILKPKNINQNVKIKFWTTDGKQANNIPKGSHLDIYTEADIKSDSLFLLTTTREGANELSDTEQLFAYQHTLLSRNRIVTQQDIKTFCKAMLNTKIQNISIKKGLCVGANYEKGIIRTLDVILHPSINNKLTAIEWNNICKSLQIKLQNRSSLTYPYRVFLKKENEV